MYRPGSAQRPANRLRFTRKGTLWAAPPVEEFWKPARDDTGHWHPDREQSMQASRLLEDTPVQDARRAMRQKSKAEENPTSRARASIQQPGLGPHRRRGRPALPLGLWCVAWHTPLSWEPDGNTPLSLGKAGAYAACKANDYWGHCRRGGNPPLTEDPAVCNHRQATGAARATCYSHQDIAVHGAP